MPQPPGHVLSTESLVQRAVAGDRQAFAELYERYLTRVYRYIYYLTGGTADVEDLTAQTFLRAWQKVPDFRPRGHAFVAWLLRIAHNVAVSHLRKRHNEQQGIPSDYQDTSRASHPDQLAQDASEAEKVRAAILALTPAEREVIVLRFVDGLSYAEAAQALGRNVNAIRVAQWRALTHLRSILSEHIERPATAAPGKAKP